MRHRQAALGRARHQQDPPEIELARKTAACSRVPCSTAPHFGVGAISPSFHDFFTIVSVLSSTFSTFLIGVRRPLNAGNLRAERIRLKRMAFFRADSAKLMLKRQVPDAKIADSRYFHVQQGQFSRHVLVPSANFTFV
jgi:hypothetical protein